MVSATILAQLISSNHQYHQYQLKMEPNEIYHVYNRGNNRQLIFFERDNYLYFLKKVEKYLVPNCEILSFTLMPNHFHFLVTPNERTNIPYRPRAKSYKNVRPRKRRIPLTRFSWGLKQLLSTYARGINKKFNRTGSLFQQNTKIKKTSSEFFSDDYSLWCFIYIHNNPKLAGLVNAPEDYEFSSYRDYLEWNEKSICNLSLGRKLLCLDQSDLFDFKSLEIPTEVLKKIFWFTRSPFQISTYPNFHL